MVIENQDIKTQKKPRPGYQNMMHNILMFMMALVGQARPYHDVLPWIFSDYSDKYQDNKVQDQDHRPWRGEATGATPRTRSFTNQIMLDEGKPEKRFHGERQKRDDKIDGSNQEEDLEAVSMSSNSNDEQNGLAKKDVENDPQSDMSREDRLGLALQGPLPPDMRR